MTKTFRMTLTPVEPYFFGNEKTFLFDTGNAGSKNRYFIKSERLPMQTTLLGSLRYLLMPIKHSNFCYTSEEAETNAAVIGPESFDIRKEEQTFGAIRSLSPIFLVNGQEYYVPTPFDHRVKDGDTRRAFYTPFESYGSLEDSEKKIPLDYVAKDGLADSFVCIQGEKPGKIVPSEELFSAVLRVGQNKSRDKKAFFKKQFCNLKTGWSFATYVTLDLDVSDWDSEQVLSNSHIVYMGQNKTAFHVTFTEEKNALETQILTLLRTGVCYLLSDALVSSSIYDSCAFASVKLRDYRAFFTHSRKDNKNESKITKGDQLYKLLAAGSVLIPKRGSELKAVFAKSNCITVGFNIIAYKEENKE